MSTAGKQHTDDTLESIAAEFYEWMAVTHYSPYSITTRRRNLSYFFAWCDDRGLIRPTDITKPILERYQRYLYYYRKDNGNPLSVRTQRTRMEAIQNLYKWLARQNYILANPASDLRLPRRSLRLPRAVLTPKEAEEIINQPDVTDLYGIRDRAVLEILYSTGIRRLELIQLTIYSIDPGNGTLMVRQGKGAKDRLVPISDRALTWVDKYLADVRPELLVDLSEDTLFLTFMGQPLAPNWLSQMVRNYITSAGITKKGACHLFRHTVATYMLENGADLRTIQHLLGHASLDTTQIYTHLSIRRIKEIHTRTHPGHQRPKAQ